MLIDVIVVALLALLTLLGYRKGFAKQLVGFLAILAVYFLATPAASVVRMVFFDSEGIAFPGVEIASLVIAGVLIFVGVWLVGRLFAASITAISDSIEEIDAALGAVLGFVKSFLVFYLVLCALVVVEAPLANAMPTLGSQMEQSYVIEGARRFNLVAMVRYPELTDLRSAMLAAGDPEKAQRNEALARLAQNEDFVSVLGDSSLMRAAQERHYSVLLSDGRVIRLLADDDFRTVLTETQWDELLED